MANPLLAFGHVYHGCIDSAARTEYIANPTTSTQADFVSPGNVACQITADAAIWVAFGANPTAAVGADGSHYILAGQTRDFGNLAPGCKVAVINAA